MRAAVLCASAAAVGNLLQGWDNACMAGAIIYIKKEFELQTQPTIEGLIVAMSLIGATVVTTFSGSLSDHLGRRKLLVISALLYCVSGLILLWAPSVYILLFARLILGLGVGLAVTTVPVYISETAPSEVRGSLNTLPQLTGSGGMFVSYCMVFGMSLMSTVSWRVMLGVLAGPSLLYFLAMVFYLPESPRWLVSKGRMEEAKEVLQWLRGKEDVAGEMALLVEGLGSGGDTSVEEYVIEPDNDESTSQLKHGQSSLIARPVTGRGSMRFGSITAAGGGAAGGGGSIINPGPGASFVDPMVTLFGSVHDNAPVGAGSMFRGSVFGSMFGAAPPPANEDAQDDRQWDDENPNAHEKYYDSDNEDDNNARHPLLSQYTSSMVPPSSGIDTGLQIRNSSLVKAADGESSELVNSTGIGGGWQLAWKYSESKGSGVCKRVFLKQEGAGQGSLLSFGGGATGGGDMAVGSMVQAAGLVSQSVINVKDPKTIGTGNVKPNKEVTSSGGPGWQELAEPGVKRALIVGIGLQICQQFCGISGIQYYTPQIFEEAGVGVLLASFGLSSTSSSLLLSTFTTGAMLPCIFVAMKLMDIAGRRSLLLNTIPVHVVSLLVLVISSMMNLGQSVNAALSMGSVLFYCCSFVMGFGPVPNILCSEIFPTRVRGMCISICSLCFWFSNIMITYSLPPLLASIGLRGVFSIYATFCAIAWVFVYLKVPETKGMPLEVISEFFKVGSMPAQQDDESLVTDP